jgi:hypothetical protein
MSGVLDFYVQSLNSGAEAILAEFDQGDEGNFTADVTANFPVELSVARDLFRFQSDAVDIMNAAETDIKYKVNYIQDTNQVDNIPEQVLGSDWLAQATCNDGDQIYVDGTSGASKNKVAHEFVRYLAHKLFNTHLGVDLFVNEEELVTELNKDARRALDATLTELTELNGGDYCVKDFVIDDGTYKHPSQVILSKIIANDSDRLADLQPYFIAGGDQSGDVAGTPAPTFRMPLMVGDTVQFKLLVEPDATQHTLTQLATAIVARSYKIQLTIVADA